MKKVLFAFSAMATAIVLSPAAFAGPITAETAINFTCGGEGVAGPGNTRLPVGGGCTAYHTGSGKNLKTFEGLSTWSNVWYQDSASGSGAFKAQSLTGSSVNPGDPYVSKTRPGNGKLSSSASAFTYHSNDGFNYSPGGTSATVSSATSATNIIPSLGSGSGGGIKQLEISNSTDTFLFSGFFFGESSTSTTLSYMIFGYNGNNLAYCIDAAGNSCTGNLSSDWVTYTPAGTVAANTIYYTLVSLPGIDAGIPVSRVYIDTKVPIGTVQYLDNYLVTETPEPDSLVLLGTGFGLVGLVALQRRRRAAARPTIG